MHSPYSMRRDRKQMSQWTDTRARQEIARLTAPGVLGIYTHFEVINLLAFQGKNSPPVNLLCLVVAEERPGPAEPYHFLNPKEDRLEVKGLKDWSFGIMRYTRLIEDLVPELESLEKSQAWSASGGSLALGKVRPLSPQFVPPDGIQVVPLNHILKNNFWSGSHAFEWALKDKSRLEFLFENPASIQDLSRQVGRYAPINFSALSDRLGNLIVQLPVTALMSTFSQVAGTTDFQVDVAWHPKIPPRPLRASLELQYDGLIAGFCSAEVRNTTTLLPIKGERGTHRGTLWDDQHQVLLSATTDEAVINTIVTTMHIGESEPRVFVQSEKDGSFTPERIKISSRGQQIRVGHPEDDPIGGWVTRRMYKNDLERLTNLLHFVQYNPEVHEKDQSHEKALKDVRKLIKSHGDEGVYLWDPFLSASDDVTPILSSTVV